MSYHLTAVRMVIINKTGNNKCWRGCGWKGSLINCWWECKLEKSLWKTVWWYLKKIKNRVTMWPSNPSSGFLPKKLKNIDSQRHMHPYIHFSIIHCRQDTGITVVSINRRLDKDNVMCVCVHYIKNKIVPFVTVWMDLKNIMLSEIIQSEKDKYHMISLICGI